LRTEAGSSSAFCASVPNSSSGGPARLRPRMLRRPRL